MPIFFYIARDKSGNKVNGKDDASTQDDLIVRLQAKGLVVINVIPQAAGGKDIFSDASNKSMGSRSVRRHFRIKGDDLVMFCRQLATLLGAGVTILKSLEVIKQQVSSQKLFDIVRDLQKHMEAGLSFHEAMSRYPEVFSLLWINLVESGEASGNLAVVLNRLATYLERNASFKKKVVSALLYPAILMVGAFSALFVMSFKIIPTFAEVFQSFNIKLPFITLVLVKVSTFIRSHILYIIIFGALGVFLLVQYFKSTNGKRNIENILMGLPLFGEFFKALVVERFTSEMSTLIESGVPILYSLEIAEHSVGNLAVAEIIRKVKDRVRDGVPLAEPLNASGFFDPMTVQMVSIGEEIGELSSMFKKLNSYYQEYVDTFLARFNTLVEPLMLVFMGVVVAILVLGMFLPIFQLTQIKS